MSSMLCPALCQYSSQVGLPVNLHQRTRTQEDSFGCVSAAACSVTGLQQPWKKARGEGVHLVGVSVPGKLKQPFTASSITKQKRLCLNYTLFVLKGGVPLRRPLALKGIYGKHVSGLGS